MATLKQCDRCKFTGTVSTINNLVSLDDGRNFDLCQTCFHLIEYTLNDGGAQYIRKDIPDLKVPSGKKG